MLIPNMQKKINRFLWYFSEIQRGFQKILWKTDLRIFLRKDFAYENMLLGLGYQTLKTASFYLLVRELFKK